MLNDILDKIFVFPCLCYLFLNLLNLNYLDFLFQNLKLQLIEYSNVF